MRKDVSDYKYKVQGENQSPKYYKTERGMVKGLHSMVARGVRDIVIYNIISIINNKLDYVTFLNKIEFKED